MNNKIIWLGLWVLASLVTACNPQPGSTVENAIQVNAWFDAPLPGTFFAPPNPCHIVAHAASPSGIAMFELKVNGELQATILSPDMQGSLVTLPIDCGLNEPGDYHLELRAQDNAGNWSNTAITSLVIGPLPEAGLFISEDESETQPDEEPTSQSEAGDGPFIEMVSISPTTTFVGGENCGPQEVTFRARAIDPQGIKVVVLFYRFQAGSTTEWQSIAMNPQGNDIFQRVLNVSALFGGNVPFDKATMQVQAVLQNNNDDTSTRTPVLSTATVLACGNQPAEPTCSIYSDPRSCTVNGCDWNLVPGSEPNAYVCQAP